MSNINATNINSNYPTPGVNNSSQGFRDNFTSIKNNLTTAKSELDDLQTKVLVKSALSGTTMDNDMSNGVIKNAQTIAFRGSTLSLGDSLVGTVAIDCSVADVHYGTLSGDVILDFQKWAPAGTRGTVEVIFTVTAGQKIEVTDAIKYGVSTIKGYTVPSAGNPYIIVPAGVTRVHYVFSSLDCGTTIEINQTDDSRIATRVKFGEPTTITGATLTFSGSVVSNRVTVQVTPATVLTTGQALYSSNNYYLGIVADDPVTSSTEYTLDVSNADIKTGTHTLLAGSLKGKLGDKRGDFLVDDSNMYVCGTDWTDGIDNIWTKTPMTDIAGADVSYNSIVVRNNITAKTFSGNIQTATIANITTANITTANITTANISNIVGVNNLTVSNITASGAVVFTGSMVLPNNISIKNSSIDSLTANSIRTDNLRYGNGMTFRDDIIATVSTVFSSSSTSILDITTGNIIASGRITAANIVVNDNINSNNITLSNLVTAKNVKTGDSINYANLYGSNGSITSSGSITAGGNIIGASLTTSGNASIGGNLDVTSNVVISGKLTLHGNIDMSGDNDSILSVSDISTVNLTASNFVKGRIAAKTQSGTPQGFIPGEVGEIVIDLTASPNPKLYVCTQTGTALTAVWKSTSLT